MALIRLREIIAEPHLAVLASGDTTPALIATDAIAYASIHDTRSLDEPRYVLKILLRGEPSYRYFMPVDNDGIDDVASSTESIVEAFHGYVSTTNNGAAETPAVAPTRQSNAAETGVHVLGKIVPFGTRLPERIPHALKRTALEHNTTVQELVTEILEDWLQTKG